MSTEIPTNHGEKNERTKKPDLYLKKEEKLMRGEKARRDFENFLTAEKMPDDAKLLDYAKKYPATILGLPENRAVKPEIRNKALKTALEDCPVVVLAMASRLGTDKETLRVALNNLTLQDSANAKQWANALNIKMDADFLING